MPVFSHKLEHNLSSCLASSKLARIKKVSFSCNIHTFVLFRNLNLPSYIKITVLRNLTPCSVVSQGPAGLFLTFTVSISIPRTNIQLFATPKAVASRSQWPRGLRRRSTAARLLRSWVRIPPAGMDVCCECCVWSGTGLCDELITRPEESYRLWCVDMCDLEKNNSRE